MIDWAKHVKEINKLKTHYLNEHASFGDGGAMCGAKKAMVLSKTPKGVTCLKCLDKMNREGNLVLLNAEEQEGNS